MKQRLKKLLAVWGVKIQPLYVLPIHTRQLRLFSYIERQYKKIADIEGDVVECGVGKGRTFLYFAFLSFEEKKERVIWGFDSFEGFPEPTSEDTSYRNPKKGDWSDTSIALVMGQIAEAGIGKSFTGTHTKLVPGFFPSTFSSYTGGKIALLHIDVDLYQSYVDALNFFFPFVSEGGVVMFDEYKHPKWPGATQAVDEFLVKTGLSLQHDSSIDKYFVVKTS